MYSFSIRLETIKQSAQTAGQLRVKSEKIAIKYPIGPDVFYK